MPIVYHQFTSPGAGLQPGYALAKDLARQCADQLDHQLNGDMRDTGIGPGSCWAAVTAVPGPGWPALVPGDHPTAAVAVGQSRMATIAGSVWVPGEPPEGFSGHAERNALRIARGLAPALSPLAVLYVQLQPCDHCRAWLEDASGGGNPFPAYATPLGPTLHVWYRWPHPGSSPVMAAWNASGLANQLHDIDNVW